VANRMVSKSEERVEALMVFKLLQCDVLSDGGPARFETCSI
jgi:hypothetical protein